MNKLLLASLAIFVVLDAVSAQAETNQLAQAQFLEAKPIVPVFPISNKTKDKHWVQLVWNGQSGKLERQGYSIVDPLVQSSAQPFWEPDWSHGVGGSNELRQVQGDDRITGNGVLTWRPEGATRFGRDNIIAQYQGTMLRGRFHGQGMWIHAGGSVYEGVWRNGLMHGSGLLTFPDGAVYYGEFHNGMFDGKGQLIDADGSVREGTFAGGRMDGRMQVSQADGAVFAANFRQGSELPGTRTAPSPDWPVLSVKSKKGSGVKGLSVTIASYEKAPFCCESGPPSLGYKTVSTPNKLTILPNNKQLMGVWYGKTNIVRNGHTFHDNRRGADHGLLNYTSKHVQPVRIKFGIRNKTGKPVRVVGAYLDMKTSRLDARPALQALDTRPTAPQNIEYVIENYGWAKVHDAVLKFRFSGKKNSHTGDQFALPLGNFKTYKLLSFKESLGRAGFTNNKQTKASKCRDSQCLNKLKKTGGFGNLANIIHHSGSRFGIRAKGKLHFKWHNADGKPVSSSSPFSGFLAFGQFQNTAECEGGGYRTVRGKTPVNLAVGKGSRRIAIDIKGNVKSGRREDWLVPMQAKKSSTHKFTFVFELSDGRKVRSRPVKLNFFRPKFIPLGTHGYGGTC